MYVGFRHLDEFYHHISITRKIDNGELYPLEGAMVLERLHEGIVIAKRKGRYKGKSMNSELHEQIRLKFTEGMNEMQIARALGEFNITCSNPIGYVVIVDQSAFENHKAIQLAALVPIATCL
jgi:DNA invertase Pin-like site-specific DNA recombinase